MNEAKIEADFLIIMGALLFYLAYKWVGMILFLGIMLFLIGAFRINNERC